MSDYILSFKLLTRKPIKKLTVDDTTTCCNKSMIKYATINQQQNTPQYNNEKNMKKKTKTNKI